MSDRDALRERLRDRPQLVRLSDLDLRPEQAQSVGEAASAMIAVNVYRELARARLEAEAASSGCQIIGNCSCSSKELV